MPLTLAASHYLFGTPDPLPVIPGYIVIANEGEWLACMTDPPSGRWYFVEEYDDHFLLHPAIADARGNPCCDTRAPEAIAVRKP